MARGRRQHLLDLDPDLGSLLSSERREVARQRLDVEVHRVSRGLWSVGEEQANPGQVGLLLLEGVIARDVVVADNVSTELLGPGDVVRPSSMQEPVGLLQFSVRWSALTDCRVALLDRRFGVELRHWPELNAVLIDRVNARAQRLATTQAISQLNGVDQRLLSLFWHLAERWGRVTAAGVAIPLALSHRMLGQLVGARRPSVSVATAELDKSGAVVRRDDGSWLLKGEPVGLPTPEAELVIPIRRRLFGSEPVKGASATPALDRSRPATPSIDTASASARHLETAGAELNETIARLLDESRTQGERLSEHAAEAQRLHELLRARREQRAARLRQAGDGHP